MKRPVFLFLLACAGASAFPPAATATDFGLQVQAPGPGHAKERYWWHFNQSLWRLQPPEKYDLTGGGELRLQRTDNPSLAASCRETTPDERDLLLKKDAKAQAAYFLAHLPGGITDAKLEAQQDNPLGFNGLKNFSVTCAYTLGGIKYRATYMVNHAAADAKDKHADPAAGEYFTAVAVAPAEVQPGVYEALQQLLITAQVVPGETPPGDSGRFVKRGVMN